MWSISNLFGWGVANPNLKQRKFTNKDFFDWIEQTNILSAVTKQMYMNKLDRILNEYQHKRSIMEWILDPEGFRNDTIEYCGRTSKKTGKPLGNQSMTSYFTVMISLILHNPQIQEQYPEILSQWKRLKVDVGKPTQDHYMSNKPNEKQIKAYIPYDELCRIRDSLPLGNKMRTLIGLYTRIPPMRADFWSMRVYKEEPKDDKGNYIVISEPKSEIVFNQYKTSKQYGQIREPIPQELVDEVASTVDLPTGMLFVNKKGEPYTRSASWSMAVTRGLRKVTNNPNFHLTMFRHSYASRPEVARQPLSKRNEIASKMGHSVMRNEQYKFADDEVPEK